MKRTFLILALVLALVIPALAQDDLETQRNNIQLTNVRVRAMIDYARATFLFQSERYGSEKERLQEIIDQNTLEIEKLTKKIEKTTPPPTE